MRPVNCSHGVPKEEAVAFGSDIKFVVSYPDIVWSEGPPSPSMLTSAPMDTVGEARAAVDQQLTNVLRNRAMGGA